MFEKFNWGHGITIFYVCFIAAVITALVASFGVDHSLVVDDYYARDLAYQSQYDKEQNSLKSENVMIVHNELDNDLTIVFRNVEHPEGTIDIYRPSDKSKDFKVVINGSETTISTKGLLPGKWVLKIDWFDNGKEFYNEKMIYL